jgi:hypothetical protein
MRIFEDEVLANDDYMRDYYDLRVASKESWVSDMSCNTPLFWFWMGAHVSYIQKNEQQ